MTIYMENIFPMQHQIQRHLAQQMGREMTSPIVRVQMPVHPMPDYHSMNDSLRPNYCAVSRLADLREKRFGR
jgi:hypothetical protein